AGPVGRPGGTGKSAGARQYCAAVLGDLGFSVREQPFEFSAFAGMWAAPVAGLLVPILATLIVLARHSRAGWVAVGVVVFGLWLLIMKWSSGRGVVDAPVLRR